MKLGYPPIQPSPYLTPEQNRKWLKVRRYQRCDLCNKRMSRKKMHPTHFSADNFCSDRCERIHERLWKEAEEHFWKSVRKCSNCGKKITKKGAFDVSGGNIRPNKKALEKSRCDVWYFCSEECWDKFGFLK